MKKTDIIATPIWKTILTFACALAYLGASTVRFPSLGVYDVGFGYTVLTAAALAFGPLTAAISGTAGQLVYDYVFNGTGDMIIPALTCFIAGLLIGMFRNTAANLAERTAKRYPRFPDPVTFMHVFFASMAVAVGDMYVKSLIEMATVHEPFMDRMIANVDLMAAHCAACAIGFIIWNICRKIAGKIKSMRVDKN